ncbi:MAG TPA: C4-type zinc ribbon domain-containing protein [bacterium]|nr:C4-type zinc ribbon domain-containing protein [bacterium]
MDGPNDYDALAALEELDGRKKELEALAASLPAEVEEREKDLAARREEFEKLRSKFENAQRERRRLEAAVDDKTQLLGKYRTQLDSVKTNKEYQSLQHEISVTRENISRTEDKLLEILEEIERAQGRVDEENRALDQLAADVASANEGAKARLRDVEVQLLEVEEKRKRLLPSLSQAVRAEYKRLFERYDGNAFAAAAGGVCRGCFVNVPAQVVAELRAGGKLYRCESCGRFIINVVDD